MLVKRRRTLNSFDVIKCKYQCKQSSFITAGAHKLSFISIIYLRFTPRVFIKTNIEPLASIQKSDRVRKKPAVLFWNREKRRKMRRRVVVQKICKKKIVKTFQGKIGKPFVDT